MSAQAMVNAGPWRQRWLRWRFHLCVLVLLVPVFFFTSSMNEERLDSGLRGLGMRELPEQSVGPWRVRLAEKTLMAPTADGEAGHTKPFVAAFCQVCIPEIRAAYLRIGKPRNVRSAGALFYGSLYRSDVQLVIPPTLRSADRIWLTVEGWDGSVHQTSWPIETASPTLYTWLKQQGKIE